MNALEKLQALRKQNKTTNTTNTNKGNNNDTPQATNANAAKESIKDKLARLKNTQVTKTNATPERLRELTSTKEPQVNRTTQSDTKVQETKAAARLSSRLQQLAELKKKNVPATITTEHTTNNDSNSASNDSNDSRPDTFSGVDNHTARGRLDKNDVSFEDLNTNQRLAVTRAGNKESFCLIGAAGSGKTTTVRSIATHLSNTGAIEKLSVGTDKVLRSGSPSIAILSYTNQAVRNIKEALPKEFKSHCSTFHMILEYAPDFYEEFDSKTLETTNKMRFLPKYGTTNYKNIDDSLNATKLPHLDIVVVEEAGSVPLELWNIFLSALPSPEETTFIFLGDLNQLPPVFDDAILGFKLLDLPIVELDTVYRNVGLVTKLAHRVLEGKPMLDKECAKWNLTDDSGTIKFMPYPKVRNWEDDLKITGTSFKKLALDGRFNPDTDVCLIPFNVKFGAVEMNRWILQGITDREKKTVHHVKAGYNDHYFCVGDRVLANKQYWYIDTIEPNTDYFGDPVTPASVHLDRWGNIAPAYRDEVLGHDDDFTSADDDLSGLLEAAKKISTDRQDGIAKRAASHIIRICQKDEEGDITNTRLITNAGDVNNMVHTAAMTVHKAQGSEFQHVFIVFHHSHAVMLNREILYTAITRSKRDLTIIYSGQNPLKIGSSAFQKGIIRQEIAGKTVTEKLKYFQAKREAELLQRKIKAKI